MTNYLGFQIPPILSRGPSQEWECYIRWRGGKSWPWNLLEQEQVKDMLPLTLWTPDTTCTGSWTTVPKDFPTWKKNLFVNLQNTKWFFLNTFIFPPIYNIPLFPSRGSLLAQSSLSASSLFISRPNWRPHVPPSSVFSGSFCRPLQE